VNSVSENGQVNSVSENGQVKIYSENSKIINAKDNSIIIFQDCPKIKFKKDKTVHVIETKTITNMTLDKFIIQHGLKEEDKSIILYKIVNNDYSDFYTGKVKYKVGEEVACNDWSNKDRECGGGLHLSPTPEFAMKYHQGKVLKCKVKIKDIKVYSKCSFADKVRCKKVFVMEEVKV
jgi:hypothetical protein